MLSCESRRPQGAGSRDGTPKHEVEGGCTLSNIKNIGAGDEEVGLECGGEEEG